MTKILKACGKRLSQFWFDFIDSFRVRPWKICTILFMVPGLFIGLFLGVHYSALSGIGENYNLVGFLLFTITILGCINIFNAMGFSSKRSWFMAIFASVVTIFLIICAFFYTKLIIDNSNDPADTYVFVTDTYISLGVVWFSIACATVASILSYFFIDKNREKD